MYKLLLATRYLKTRTIALVSIISVTLGVATMIVVNSVMAGFSGEMQDRLRGLLSDVAIITHNSDGFQNPEEIMDIVNKAFGSEVVAMTPTVEMWGMMTFHVMGQDEQRPVRIVGIIPEGKNQVSPLAEYLLSRQANDLSNRPKPDGPEVPLSAPVNWSLTPSAISYRDDMALHQSLRIPATLPAAQEPIQVAEGEPSTVTDAPMYDPGNPGKHLRRTPPGRSVPTIACLCLHRCRARQLSPAKT